MKDIFECHFDEILLVFVLIAAAGLYLVRPDTKDLLLAPVAGALLMALRGKTTNGGSGNAKTNGQTSAGNPAVKAGMVLVIASLICICAAPVYAQAQPTPKNLPTEFYAATIGYNSANTTSIQGSGTYAHRLGDNSPVYILTTYDISAVPSNASDLRIGTLHLPTIQAQVRPGAMVWLRSFGKGHLFALAEAGIAAGDNTVGGSFGGGGAFAYDLGHNWFAVGVMKFVKNNLTGTQILPQLGIAYRGK